MAFFGSGAFVSVQGCWVSLCRVRVCVRAPSCRMAVLRVCVCVCALVGSTRALCGRGDRLPSSRVRGRGPRRWPRGEEGLLYMRVNDCGGAPGPAREVRGLDLGEGSTPFGASASSSASAAGWPATRGARRRSPWSTPSSSYFSRPSSRRGRGGAGATARPRPRVAADAGDRVCGPHRSDRRGGWHAVPGCRNEGVRYYESRGEGGHLGSSARREVCRGAIDALSPPRERD